MGVGGACIKSKKKKKRRGKVDRSQTRGGVLGSHVSNGRLYSQSHGMSSANLTIDHKLADLAPVGRTGWSKTEYMEGCWLEGHVCS